MAGGCSGRVQAAIFTAPGSAGQSPLTFCPAGAPACPWVNAPRTAAPGGVGMRSSTYNPPSAVPSVFLDEDQFRGLRSSVHIEPEA